MRISEGIWNFPNYNISCRVFSNSPIGTRYGENDIVRVHRCCVGSHVVDLHRTRFPLLAEFSVESDPFSVTRVCARESVIGRFDNPTVGSDIRQLRSSSLIISYLWWFFGIFRDFLELFRKPGNPDRPIRAGESPIFRSLLGVNLVWPVLGKLLRTSFLIFCNFPKSFRVRGCGSDPGFRSGFSPSWSNLIRSIWLI